MNNANDNTSAATQNDPLEQPTISRRQFLAGLSLALGAVTAAMAGIPIVGFMISPLLQKTPQTWRSVGAVNDFKVGQTVAVSFVDASPLPWAGVTAKTAAWLRRDSEQQFTAFAINCTHLGCPVRWLQEANLFMCPCHGGVYYNDGTVAAGPPPEPLAHYEVRVREGQVEIRTGSMPIG
jgi:menaquinol-cytochrome c reductase iron-sulfur subunit